MPQNKYFGDAGLDSLEVGGNNPIFSFLTSTMASGKALADDGKAYDSVQDAENAASSFVLVGPGTFSESVTIDTAGLTLAGAGYDTLIDGGTTGTAITIDATDVSVLNLSVQTTAGAGNSFVGIGSGASANSGKLVNVTVRDSDSHGINPTDGDYWRISNCTVESADGKGIDTDGPENTVISHCIVQSGVSDDGILTRGDDSIVANCIVVGVADDGIYLLNNDNIGIGNRIHNAGATGFDIGPNSTDSICANNRISDSGGSDINNQGSGTVLDDNQTGASN